MKSLYRKYRPLKIEDVVGQEQVTVPLSNALKAGKIGHAYLFTGPRGTGKTSVARILAHQVNGFNYELEDDYVDIIEIDGASNRGIDNIRELREKAAIAPTAGKYKVYIIDEVHMLTKEAFNALLKTLEEPPEHVIFIMATTDAYKVPVTITSRSQIYNFQLADTATMMKHLRDIVAREGIKITDGALEIVARRGGGSFRDTLSLLDQISTLSDDEITAELIESAMGLPEDAKITELLELYTSGDVVKITTVLRELLASGIKPETIAEEMISRIVDNPQPELFPLLEKLPDVKSPFAEARLIVALAGASTKSVAPVASNSGGFRSAAARELAPAGPSGRGQSESVRSGDGSLRPVVTGEAPSFSVVTLESPRADDSRLTSKPDTSPGRNGFDWAQFVERVRGLNDAISMQLNGATYEFAGDTLKIYPAKKIAKTILSRDNNKRILVEAAGGVKITVSEPGENRVSGQKDALISQISDIMGGEVLDDGGGNPF